MEKDRNQKDERLSLDGVDFDDALRTMPGVKPAEQSEEQQDSESKEKKTKTSAGPNPNEGSGPAIYLYAAV